MHGKKIHRAPEIVQTIHFCSLKKKIRPKPNRFSAPFYTPAWLKSVLLFDISMERNDRKQSKNSN